uniref:NADH dehydrogenase subunit 6 n=1 Tax=Tomocerus caputiviolaceus TaxID=2763923 RepID=UPI0021D526EE|nr:NADH dehydrogenase subunit 6 [Tomocerus caputiviolaceus]UXC95413.1 NADH dehydrogenase subunit 6 [Tomocerus caputiviolaceus]
MKMIMFMSVIPSTLFIMSSHPISMMIVIIMQTFILCLSLWLMLNISWFSYIMFLIFLGGIMILFIYIASLASNEKFFILPKHSFNQILFMSTMMMISLVTVNSQINKMNKMEFSEMVFKIYSNSLMNMTLFTIFYLIFTLIVVVKMTSLLDGPLRSKN